MSDPQPARLKKRPARAKPIQPDRPGRANEADAADPAAEAAHEQQRVDANTQKSREQAEAARKNVSEGFGQ